MYSAVVVQEVCAKATRALKMRSIVAGNHQSWSSYNYMRSCPMSTILWSFSIWSKLERWKSSISGCLLKWMKNKKVVILMCYLLLFYTTTMNHFSNGLWCATKKVDFIMTISDDQLSVLTKKKLQSTSQSQMFTKKSSLSLFVGLLLVWSTTAFWIAVKPLHLRSILSKSMRYTKNCVALKPALVNRKGEILL